MKYLIVISCFCFLGAAQAQTLNAGLKLQKTQNMYWENGISAQYAFEKFKPERFYIGFDFISSRLGSALGNNALKQDRYIFSASWLFRKNKAFQIYSRLNTGYFYADLEYDFFDDLPNTAFLLSPELGLSYSFKEYPIAVNFGSGFNVTLVDEGKSPGTLQPLYYHLSLYYNLFKNKKDETATN